MDLDRIGTFQVLAVHHKNIEQIRFYLEHRGDPNPGAHGHICSSLACFAQFDVSLKILNAPMAAGGTIEESRSGALRTAADKGRADLVIRTLEKGAGIDKWGFLEDCPVDSRADEVGSALHYAAKAGQVEAVRLLLEKGANRDLKETQKRTARQERRTMAWTML